MDRQAEVQSEMEKLQDVYGKHRKRWLELSQKRNDEFNDGFQKICLATQEIYQMITLGGDAILEKVNSMDTFNEGITFQ
jgi:structural maintenance of chromosome 4